MRLTQFLPFRVSKTHFLLIGIAIGIASQRIPEVKLYTDYILQHVNGSFDVQSLILLFQKYKNPLFIP
ncbi:hypothetical protein PNK_1301 [Candidatus Protochlamydia naegleriophila]|uniref:Uncharacterized protein n=1 Tax=Candidatus Protochlamydia naegleriophila TaxID=389348 RepID=A0A0U5JGM5_9BACT|nr:hypothetical protein PNK_1301 [Candidatus Protochlamydia naegleriophila]